MDPVPDPDPRVLRPKKKNYTQKCSTKSFKITLQKSLKLNKQK